jgi:hypothetical protein
LVCITGRWALKRGTVSSGFGSELTPITIAWSSSAQTVKVRRKRASKGAAEASKREEAMSRKYGVIFAQDSTCRIEKVAGPHAMLSGMGAIGQFLMLIGVVVPMILIVWYLFSSLGRITRGIEDIALTLRRIEQGGSRLTP